MQRARAARHGQDMAYIQIRGELPLKFRDNVACCKNIAFKHPRHARKLGLAEVVAEIGNSPSHRRRACLLRERWHLLTGSNLIYRQGWSARLTASAISLN